MWPFFFNVLSVSACFLCMIVAMWHARNAILVPESLAQRLRYCESLTQSTKSSLTELTETVEALAQRVKMQRVRNVVTHADKVKGDGALPDPYTDPDGWRSAMTKRLTEQRFNLKGSN